MENWTVHRLEETRSTNLDARAGRPGDVWTAEFQSAGRGRLDHAWTSRRGENLTFSAVLDASGRAPEEVATLPLVVGLAVARALEEIVRGGERGGGAASTVRIKWPNDILADGRKICGILCERADDRVIAGIGINVNQTEFPPEIAARATSLARMTGAPLDREQVLQGVLRSISDWVARWRAAGFAALQGAFAPYDFLKGRRVAVRQTDDDAAPLAGLCGGIASDGTLLVGGRSVSAGEAHVCDF